jgi:hypothetical protein
MSKFEILLNKLKEKAKWWDKQDEYGDETATPVYIALMELASIIEEMLDEKKKKRKR